jgi:hypothetical protein
MTRRDDYVSLANWGSYVNEIPAYGLRTAQMAIFLFLPLLRADGRSHVEYPCRAVAPLDGSEAVVVAPEKGFLPVRKPQRSFVQVCAAAARSQGFELGLKLIHDALLGRPVCLNRGHVGGTGKHGVEDRVTPGGEHGVGGRGIGDPGHVERHAEEKVAAVDDVLDDLC